MTVTKRMLLELEENSLASLIAPTFRLIRDNADLSLDEYKEPRTERGGPTIRAPLRKSLARFLNAGWHFYNSGNAVWEWWDNAPEDIDLDNYIGGEELTGFQINDGVNWLQIGLDGTSGARPLGDEKEYALKYCYVQEVSFGRCNHDEIIAVRPRTAYEREPGTRLFRHDRNGEYIKLHDEVELEIAYSGAGDYPQLSGLEIVLGDRLDIANQLLHDAKSMLRSEQARLKQLKK